MPIGAPVAHPTSRPRLRGVRPANRSPLVRARADTLATSAAPMAARQAAHPKASRVRRERHVPCGVGARTGAASYRPHAACAETGRGIAESGPVVAIGSTPTAPLRSPCASAGTVGYCHPALTRCLGSLARARGRRMSTVGDAEDLERSSWDVNRHAMPDRRSISSSPIGPRGEKSDGSCISPA